MKILTKIKEMNRQQTSKIQNRAGAEIRYTLNGKKIIILIKTQLKFKRVESKDFYDNGSALFCQSDKPGVKELKMIHFSYFCH